jgi:hypothetical protein
LERRIPATATPTPPIPLVLETLERLVLRSVWLQKILLMTHEHALRRLLPYIRDVRSVMIVGGGMYPRTALILQKLLPDAKIRIIDANREHLDAAETFLSGGVEFEHGLYDPTMQSASDLLVIPLSFQGDRAAIYRDPPARLVLVHDWIWSRRGASAIVSIFLLKRMNLIAR